MCNGNVVSWGNHMATIDAQFRIELQETTRLRIQFGILLPKMHLCSEFEQSAYTYYAMFFFQWMENWRVFYCSLFAANLYTFHTHANIVSKTQRKPKHKKTLRSIWFCSFRSRALLTIWCRVTTKNDIAWVPCTISSSKFMFWTRNDVNGNCFWFAFSLDSLSLYCVRYFLKFYWFKTSFFLVYSMAWIDSC